METKELKIAIPEGYCVDESKSTFEKIVFKKKDTKPRSWKEYLCKGNHPNKLWFIDPVCKNTDGICITEGALKDIDLNKTTCHMGAYLPSKELAEAFLAMMQLMSLRQAWIGDWKPNWKNDNTRKWCIIFECELTVCYFYSSSRALSFPTKEMAEDFMNTFKDLLEIAKPLI